MSAYKRDDKAFRQRIAARAAELGYTSVHRVRVWDKILALIELVLGRR